MHRFICVEGLPCSGKSTTSKHIANQLSALQKNVCWIDEGTGNHPADYEGHCFLKKTDLAQFSKEDLSRLFKTAEEALDGFILPLDGQSSPLIPKLLPYKIYDFLPWSVERPLMLNKWSRFAKEADPETTYVFNCCFLQNPMCETMMRFGFDYGDSLSYISKIHQTIKPLNPLIVYLSESSIHSRIQEGAQSRSPEWLEAVIQYHTEGAYGKSHQLEGFDGYISCLEERQKRELQILESLSIPTLILKDAGNDWAASYETLDHYLKAMK